MARTCLRWEECVVWEEGGWGPRGKRCGAFQKDRFLWEIFPEIKVLSAEIRVRKYTYNRREILVWAKFEPTTSGRGGEKTVHRIASQLTACVCPELCRSRRELSNEVLYV